MIKLAIITTHPIQYYAPVFKLLAQSSQVSIKVFYTWKRSGSNTIDPGFGKAIEWDIPLLEGYNHTFVTNTSKQAGSHHYKGIVNPGLNTEIVNWGASAILVFGWNYQSHLAAMRYFKGKIPVFFRGDSHLLDEQFGLRQVARRILLRWVYSHVNYVFYVGQNNKRYFRAHGIKETQLIFAPHAIDNKRFTYQQETYAKEAMNWRDTLGIQPGNIVFLFSGKLEPKKDPLLLLESFVSLRDKNAHLVFVGNGVLESQLKQQAKPYENIHFINFQNQSRMPVVYRLGNVFILPSQGPGETWGLAVNEAMACGLPVIISDKVGCAVDLVQHNINGYLFASGKKEELTERMRMILLNHSHLQKMGNQSVQIIEHWSIPLMVNYIEKAIVDSQ